MAAEPSVNTAVLDAVRIVTMLNRAGVIVCGCKVHFGLTNMIRADQPLQRQIQVSSMTAPPGSPLSGLMLDFAKTRINTDGTYIFGKLVSAELQRNHPQLLLPVPARAGSAVSRLVYARIIAVSAAIAAVPVSAIDIADPRALSVAQLGWDLTRGH